MKNAIGCILSAAVAVALAYCLNDPFLALAILVPAILIWQFIVKKISKDK